MRGGSLHVCGRCICICIGMARMACTYLAKDEAERNDLAHHFTEEEECEEEVELLEEASRVRSRIEARAVDSEADRRDDDGRDHHLVELRLLDETSEESTQGVARAEDE